MTTIEELKQVAYKISEFAYIAGGFYKDVKKGKEPKDIDVFFKTKNGYEQVAQALEKITGYTRIQNKISLTIGKFELIKPVSIAGRLLFGEPKELVPTFDIDIARVWIDEDGLQSTEDIDDLDWEIENDLFKASIYHEDEKRTIDRIERYETYGYRCLQIVREEHSSKKKNKCTLSGGYND